MELKNRIWMTGNLEWFAYLETMVLSRPQGIPYPLREGDRWTNGYDDTFHVVDGEITRESVNPVFQNSILDVGAGMPMILYAYPQSLISFHR